MNSKKFKKRHPRHRISCSISDREYKVLRTEAQDRHERLSSLMQDKLLSKKAPKIMFSDDRQYVLLFGKVCMISNLQSKLSAEINHWRRFYANALITKASMKGHSTYRSLGKALLTDEHSKQLQTVINVIKSDIAPKMTHISRQLHRLNEAIYSRLH